MSPSSWDEFPIPTEIPPAINSLPEPMLRLASLETWQSACRLRLILDDWQAWFNELRAKGDADPGWAMRYREMACECIRAIHTHRPSIEPFNGQDAKAICEMLPPLPRPRNWLAN